MKNRSVGGGAAKRLRTTQFRKSVTPDEVTFDGTMTVRQSEFGMNEAARKTKDEVPVQVSFRGRRE